MIRQPSAAEPGLRATAAASGDTLNARLPDHAPSTMIRRSARLHFYYSNLRVLEAPTMHSEEDKPTIRKCLRPPMALLPSRLIQRSQRLGISARCRNPEKARIATHREDDRIVGSPRNRRSEISAPHRQASWPDRLPRELPSTGAPSGTPRRNRFSAVNAAAPPCPMRRRPGGCPSVECQETDRLADSLSVGTGQVAGFPGVRAFRNPVPE